MKKILVAVAAAVLFTSCGLTQSSSTSSSAQSAARTTTTSTNPALTAGQSAGSALQALRQQYVLDGNKYDYTNFQNIANTAILLGNCEGLKTNYKDKTYLAEFGKGLVAGSLGLVTQSTAQTVTNSLVNLVTSSSAAQTASTKVQETASTAANYADTAAGYANTAAQYAGALSSLLGAFGGK